MLNNLVIDFKVLIYKFQLFVLNIKIAVYLWSSLFLFIYIKFVGYFYSFNNLSRNNFYLFKFIFSHNLSVGIQ